MPALGRRVIIDVYTADQNLLLNLEKEIGANLWSLRRHDPQSFLSVNNGDNNSSALVIVDIGDGEVLDDAEFHAARDRIGMCPLILISQPLTAEKTRKLVPLRIAEWLERPLLIEPIMDAISRVVRIGSTTTKVYTFIGANGGSGATTMALLLADYLAAQDADVRIAVVDLDFHHSGATTFLNYDLEVDAAGIIQNPDRIDDELLEALAFPVDKNKTYYTLNYPELYATSSPERIVLELLNRVTDLCDILIIDLPFMATKWFTPVVKNSSRIFTVCEVNLSSLRNEAKLLATIKDRLQDTSNITVLANKSKFKLIGNEISKKDVSALIGVDDALYVGEDRKLFQESLNSGESIFNISINSRVSVEIQAAFKSALK